MIFTLILTCFSCDEMVCTDCNGSGYLFQDSVSIQPNVETISIGDTLWLSCEISKKQKDLVTGNIVEYSNAKNISLVFKIQRLLGKNSVNYALNDFEILIKQGAMVKHFLPEGALEVLLVNSANSYLYKVGLVPKKNVLEGIYFLSYSEIIGVHDDKQRSASYYISFHNKNQHLDLYHDNMPAKVLASDLAKAMYCFGVAE